METDVTNLELLNLFKEICDNAKSKIKDENLSPLELLTLITIYDNDNAQKEPLLAKDIADKIGVAYPSFSRILANLEDKKLVIKVIPSNNKRIVQIHLSPKAHKELYERTQIIFSKLDIIRKELGNDFEKVFTSLIKIKEILER